jgi:hypothetical protein
MEAQTLSHSVQIEATNNPTVAARGSGRFFANLLSRVPSAVIFFFRLILMMGAVIAVTGTVFAFSARTVYNKK